MSVRVQICVTVSQLQLFVAFFVPLHSISVYSLLSPWLIISPGFLKASAAVSCCYRFSYSFFLYIFALVSTFGFVSFSPIWRQFLSIVFQFLLCYANVL